MTYNTQYDTEARHALSGQNFQNAVHVRNDLIRDELFDICVLLDRSTETCHLFIRDPDRLLPNADLPQLEQRATKPSIPGDIALRLKRDFNVQTFYDIAVVNSLTDQ